MFMTHKSRMTSTPPSFAPLRLATLQRKCSCGGSSTGGGECAECQKKQTLQRRATDDSQPDSAPPIVHDVLRSPGQPLDAGTRAFMEPRFGHDFSKVRVHADARAAESARAVNAAAYTVGQDVVFGAGQYQPNAAAGRQLLGHELTHVVQQHGQIPATSRLLVGPSDDVYEREAGQAALNLATGRGTAAPQVATAASPSVQRQSPPGPAPSAPPGAAPAPSLAGL